MRLQYFPMIATRTFSTNPGCKTRRWPRIKHSSKIVINTLFHWSRLKHTKVVI